MDHDTKSLPERSGAWSADSGEPDQTTIDRVIAATIDHPLAIDAQAQPFCHATMMCEPKSFIDRFRWDDDIKSEIREKLRAVETVFYVEYQTSTKAPEPLSGGGAAYGFLLHPDSLEILHTSTGTWRA